MDADEFCEKWGITRSEFCLLTDIPYGTTAHWMGKSKDRNTPSYVRRLLLVWDLTFSRWLGEESDYGDARAIFEAAKERGEGKVFQG